MIGLINGSASAVPLRSRSVQVIVTSPPYYDQRAYEGDQAVDWPAVTYVPMIGLKPITIEAMCAPLGQEPTPEAYTAHLVLIFRELWRVLRDDGLCWLNLGDSYSAGGRGSSKHHMKKMGLKTALAQKLGRREPPPGLKPKNMMGIPERVAFALQADGWYLRFKLPWLKPNAMPSSAEDRPGHSTEEVFVLSKSERYYYDRHAVLMPPADYTRKGGSAPYTANGSTTHGIGSKSLHQMAEGGRNRRSGDWWDESLDAAIVQAETWLAHARAIRQGENGMLVDTGGLPLALRVNTKGWPGSHYATFNTDLIEPMLRASTSAAGCCPRCGAPWERVVAHPDFSEQPTRATTKGDGTPSPRGFKTSAGQAWQAWRNANPDITTGWRPTCGCSVSGQELAPDDLEMIATPTGERVGEDPSYVTGRAGLNRPRGENEGTRPITRYEQRAYADQIRRSPHRKEMAAGVGESTLAHYMRKDRNGARPVPAETLDEWIARGWLEPVEVPDPSPLPPVPCTVMDPFAGSGTVGEGALKLGLRAVLLDISHPYLAGQAKVRLQVDRLEAWQRGEGVRAQDEAIDDLPLFSGMGKENV